MYHILMAGFEGNCTRLERIIQRILRGGLDAYHRHFCRVEDVAQVEGLLLSPEPQCFHYF